MSKTISSLKIFTLLVLGASAGAANATYINGTMAIGGGLLTSILGTTNYVVSQLNLLEGNETGQVNSVTGVGDFNSLLGVPAALQKLDISSTFAMQNALIWQIGDFSFIASQIFSGPTRNPLTGSDGNLSDAVTLRFIGTVKATGFEDTGFLADITANGNCTGVGTTGPCTVAGTSVGSWSASIGANGHAPGIPEPTSLSLFGIGLAGWAASRRKKAKAVAAE